MLFLVEQLLRLWRIDLQVVVTCGLSDSKLAGKLAGLVHNNRISRIILIRRRPLSLDKVNNICPPSWISQSTIFFEVWRLLMMLKYSWDPKIELVVGIQAQLHGVVAVLVGKLFNVKSTLWLIGSDLYIYSRRGMFSWVIRYCIRVASTIYVMGGSAKAVVYDVTGRVDRVFVNQVFVELTESWESIGNREKEWDLIFAGNLVKVKNPLFALDIFVQLFRVHPKLKLCVIGDGCLRFGMEKIIHDLGIERNVSLLGHVSNPEYYISRSKVLIITSFSESLPSVLLESCVLGVPVVSSSVGEITTLSKQCTGVVCCPPEAIGCFTQKIRELLEQPIVYTAAVNSAVEFGESYKREWSLEKLIDVWNRSLVDID